MTRRDDDDWFEATTEEREQEAQEAALARADLDAVNYPMGWGEPS
jgi:hypothetical protein